MLKKYSDEMLQQINDNADLIGYASQIFELEKKGDDYFAHCPKHVDKTPSLSFTPSKNSYYCFSCGCSGGIIGFLMDFENLDFDSAVEKASKLAHVDISKMCQSNTVAFLRKYKSLQDKRNTPKYQHQVLDRGVYSKYTKARIQSWINEGIKPEVLDLFEVRLDTFANRIVYPVYDMDGQFINVKGRTTIKEYKALKIPKYINYYTVGVMDYFQGANVTMPYIKQANEVIIFESIKSVMKAYGWGYKNSLSAEKHTLTDEQIEILARLNVNVVFAYDSDISYSDKDVKQSIDKLKRITNVYIIQDKDNLLGGKEAKNAPVDLGQGVWEELYESKRKVI